MDPWPSIRTVGARLSIVVVLVLIITAGSGSVAAHSGDDGAHHHDGWMGTHGGTGGWMVGGIGFLWMVLWAIVVIGVPLTLGYLILTRRGADDRTDDALDLLRRRYAQGDVDDEEFETRRRKLLDEQN